MDLWTTIMLALVWLLLLGWGFHALLRCHSGLDDQLADKEAQLAVEKHARFVAERALAQSQQTLAKLLKQQDQVRESERQRIARDIHDDLGQQLLALKVDLSLLGVSANGAHPIMARKLVATVANLDRAIGSLRAIVHDLRPAMLGAGLPAAIGAQLREFSRINGVRHSLHIDQAATDAGPDKERDTMLFRMLQETLSNIIRHAHATEVAVALQCCGPLLTLRIHDNGIGLPDPARTPASDPCCVCTGLNGMRDRLSAIGGGLLIESKPGAGTCLSLSIPMPRQRMVDQANR